MKTLVVTFFSALISMSAISQDFKYLNDDRPQNIKEDRLNTYQADRINEIDILKALEMAGVRIFNIPIFPAFKKEYMLSICLNEYAKGEKISSRYIHRGTNIYRYSVKDTIKQEYALYTDYIPKLTLFSKDNDTTVSLKFEHYGNQFGTRLTKKKVREWQQSYYWRTYSKTDWKLNEEVPLLVYASAWYDESFEAYRFCGAVDLSLDEEATKDLFDNSPHYYIISLKVSNE